MGVLHLNKYWADKREAYNLKKLHECISSPPFLKPSIRADERDEIFFL